ncbi:hypothetical protein QZN29_02850 [Burkholderia multivorans]|uniref:hypothetical protein n=1 Tax=Burkholderia multivorans TaxID=87883 RepID=UPI0015E2F90E|nr:hypothetical protein [Burkholderia multivorans]MDN8088726.1 hypothetical protein [Burkholderia multivorans]MDN8094690.1 hypothetical protein [Burkholderia multivorans]MDN8107773.1 hypothetical protein [Burkholderia multivorans]MDN8126175.1 hypothetical protein [Burkholderia multivorans]MDN8130720.1 hypothetical protein [Burkholderia multivorans]
MELLIAHPSNGEVPHRLRRSLAPGLDQRSVDRKTDAGGKHDRDSSGIARDDDSSPRNNAEWIRYFADRHGVEIDHMSAHQRAKAFPLFAAWTKAGVTRRQVDTAVAKAQAEATEPIAFLPAYVDRVLASMAAPRASPQPSWSDQNAQTIAALTGRNRSHGPDDRIIDV